MIYIASAVYLNHDPNLFSKVYLQSVLAPQKPKSKPSATVTSTQKGGTPHGSEVCPEKKAKKKPTKRKVWGSYSYNVKLCIDAIF